MLNDITPQGQRRRLGTDGVVAHLALDAPFVSFASAGHDAFLQDLIQHDLMQRPPVQRGEKKRTAGVCDGPPGQHAQRTRCPYRYLP